MTITPRPKIQIYDSSTRKKQPLLAEGGDTSLRMYLCGPTVYHHIHVGNARTFAVFSLFVRYLRHRGIDVTFVSNITDINDKIYTAASEQGLPSGKLAATAAQWYIDDTTRLGLGRPDHEPKATDFVPQMIKLITELIEHGAAYESGGDVYYRVTRFPPYGKLSNRQVDDMVAGSRDDLEAAGKKEHALDFALWKATKAGEDTSWDSPWGKGRPGWHIECSAMASELLGESFDVHAGGIGPDLPAPRERDRAVVWRGPRVRPPVDAFGHAADRWRQDGQERGQHRHARRGARRLACVGGRDVLPDGLIPQPTRFHRGCT